MLCAISGEVPQSPVISTKSGHVFEKNLIESYIKENGRDPITQEELGVEDLLEIKSARVARPRPPTFTSIPSLLSEFQREWDAVALETFNLRQQLQQTRQELSTALYQNDAAISVIARLTAERDEARGALAKIGVKGHAATNGDSMQVDGAGLPEDLASQVDSTQEKLSRTRRKRPIPDEWATNETLRSWEVEPVSSYKVPGSASLSLNESGDEALVSGESGQAEVFSISRQQVVQKLEPIDGTVTAVAWSDARCIVASATGGVSVFEEGRQSCAFSQHSDAATAVAVHPSGALLASVSLDKSFVYYDTAKASPVTQVYSNSGLTTAAFHPDGHLFAAGARDGQVKVFDVKLGANVANFDTSDPVKSLDFSENGTWLATVSGDQTSVRIWDLRKSAQIKSLEVGYAASGAKWDYTGQFLAVAGSQGVSIHQYSKATKEWSELGRHATPSVSVAWGPNAQSLVVLGSQGSIFELK